MKTLLKNDWPLVAAAEATSASDCKGDVGTGFGIGATLGGGLGAAIGGPAGGFAGAAIGGLAGMAVGGSNSAGCAPSGATSTSGSTGNAGTVSATANCTAGNNPSAVSCDSSDSGGDGGKVICTELCRNGLIDHDVWMADLAYSRKHFNEQTMRGYHAWGVPYVKLMRKSPLFAKLAQHPTQAFAQDIAYRMGVRAKPNYMGWVLRELAFRPVCWSIGVFAKARDFQHLWTGKIAAA